MVNLEQVMTQLFVEKVQRYTMGKSSSLKAVKAEQIIRSMEWTLRVGQEMAKAAHQVFSGKDEQLLRNYMTLGEQRLKGAYRHAKQLHEYLLSTRLPLDVLAYQDTIQKGIPKFILKYDPEFSAHEAEADIDYPLASDDQTLLGALYMENYLKSLVLENEFCRLFELEQLAALFETAQREKLFNAREDLYNLFEVIYQQVMHRGMLGLGMMNDGDGLTELALTSFQRERLLACMLSITESDQSVMLQNVHRSLVEALEKKVLHRLTDAFEKDYLAKALDRYAAKLTRWTVAGGPPSEFVVTISETEKPLRTQLTAASMADEAWRTLYFELLALDDFEAKWTLTKAQIQSPEDLVELIKAEAFSKEELERLAHQLNAEEREVLAHQLMDFHFDFSKCTVIV